MCSFFAFNLEKFTPDRNFYTGSARGARDKYEVCKHCVTGAWLESFCSCAFQVCGQMFTNNYRAGNNVLQESWFTSIVFQKPQ